MDRRWGGVLVLVIAVIGALAGNARTKQIAGDPLRGQVPGPPSVGECLLESPKLFRSGTVDSIDVGSAGATYPSLRLGTCTTRRFGEVVGVVADATDRRADDSDAWGDPSSPVSQCNDMFETYLGPADFTDDPPHWSPAPYPGLLVVGPNPVQRADGQRWLGCLAVGVDPTGDGAYTGSVQGEERTWRFPPELAQCQTGQPSPAGASAAGCRQPHRVELLAIGYSDDSRPARQAGAEDSCVDLATSMTGLADPTAAGRLRVRALGVPLPPDPNTQDTSTANPTQWYCTIEPNGDHVLTGPLLGLDDRPLPVR